jgi:hypothetical protein
MDPRFIEWTRRVWAEVPSSRFKTILVHQFISSWSAGQGQGQPEDAALHSEYLLLHNPCFSWDYSQEFFLSTVSCENSCELNENIQPNTLGEGITDQQELNTLDQSCIFWDSFSIVYLCLLQFVLAARCKSANCSFLLGKHSALLYCQTVSHIDCWCCWHP